MLNFLDNLDAPFINPEKRTDLDKPITLNEVISSISAMQSAKAPGPDGYPVEFYKRFSPKLVPLLLEMFNHSLDQGALPQTLTEANITLLLKPGKNAAVVAPIGPYRF